MFDCKTVLLFFGNVYHHFTVKDRLGYLVSPINQRVMPEFYRIKTLLLVS